MLTGIGGGLARDVLVSDMTAVFRGEIYAVAALAGAVVVGIGHILYSIQHGWQLPVASREIERSWKRAYWRGLPAWLRHCPRSSSDTAIP
jgi:uncharacterized membrane protein YeiH